LTKYYIGLEAKWEWISSDGSPLQNNMWDKGYPVQSGLDEAWLDPSSSKMVNRKSDTSIVGGVCKKHAGKYYSSSIRTSQLGRNVAH